ncbi:MAG: Fe-S cluster assembly protein IscX [Alphaproteobacteria bacterium]|jgi:FeS assembly protein IscX|nr:Fe-S cluster assembly protein IscX [Alphaproteobacteria bacterium]
MKWLDIIDVAIALEEEYPDVDVKKLTFTQLRSMVISLVDFKGDRDGANEKILEAIQMAWLDERDDNYEIDD